MPAPRRVTGALTLAVAGVFGSFVVVGLSTESTQAATLDAPTSVSVPQDSATVVADEPGLAAAGSSSVSLTEVSDEPGNNTGETTTSTDVETPGDTTGGAVPEETTGGSTGDVVPEEPTGGSTGGETVMPTDEGGTEPTNPPVDPPVETTPEDTGSAPDPGTGEAPAPQQPQDETPIRQEPGGPTGAPDAAPNTGGSEIVPDEPGHRGGSGTTTNTSSTQPSVKPSPTVGPSSASETGAETPSPTATPDTQDLAETGAEGNVIGIASAGAILVAIGALLMRRRRA